MAYTTIDDPTIYFSTVLYAGNRPDGGGGSQNITGVGFSPDWVWIKCRSASKSHYFFDTVRGVNTQLNTNNTNDENVSSSLTHFLSDGFTLSDEPEVNLDGETYVAWNWKCETAFTNDASATSIGTIDTAGQANNTAGISIATWTGTGNVGTIKHGLSSTPQWAMIKNRSEDSRHWNIYHKDINNTHYFQFDTNAKLDDAGVFDDTSPTSSVMTIGASNRGNENTKSHIGYFFSEIKGYSKFGSYTGNGSADGTFVYTGFKPAWTLIKRIDSSTGGSWILFDNKRGVNVVNPIDVVMAASNNQSESDWGTAYDCDYLSNGFKWRHDGSSTYVNVSGATYVFMAFAENPFVNSNGVPNNAR